MNAPRDLTPAMKKAMIALAITCLAAGVFIGIPIADYRLAECLDTYGHAGCRFYYHALLDGTIIGWILVFPLWVILMFVLEMSYWLWTVATRR